MKIKFKDLTKLNDQLHEFKEKTACWYELSRNKIRAKRIVDAETESYMNDRQIILDRYGILLEDGTLKSKTGTDPIGRPIQVYDFGENDKEANEKLESLFKEQSEKEFELDIFIPKPENVRKTLEMDLSSHNMEYIVEYILVDPNAP